MSSPSRPLVSVTVPLYNEAAGILAFHQQLLQVIKAATNNSYEIIYCDDGSTDDTAALVHKLCAKNSRVKLITLSRNFGKESALSASIHQATGDGILMLDGDGQHPVELIPDFITAWQNGADVIIGLRSDKDSESTFKRFGSWLFYKLFNRLTGQKMTPGTTDYRLIDRSVQQAFLSLTETDRITRGLIDWLGFKRQFIPVHRLARTAGAPGYTFSSLMKLATNSFVSMSSTPLYFFGYIGVFIASTSFVVGLAVLIEQIILRDPWQWQFTGSAMLGILILFLVGIILISQGVISLYISHMHSQTKGRPLYVINYKESAGIDRKSDVK
jgi:dolichol-phosphate mannosyltransferase